jgi:hypothetical protein
MPKVGTKHFSYDQSGPIENEDKNYAQFAGGGSVMKPKMYGKGGSVRGYGKARAPKGKK